MSIEILREFQAYGYFFFIAFLAVMFYSYIYHLYSSQRKNKRDYEKYAQLALHDNINDVVVEERRAS